MRKFIIEYLNHKEVIIVQSSSDTKILDLSGEFFEKNYYIKIRASSISR